MADDLFNDNLREDFLETVPPYSSIEENIIQEKIGGGSVITPGTTQTAPQIAATIVESEVKVRETVEHIQDELNLEGYINLLGKYEDSDLPAPVKMIQRRDDAQKVGASHKPEEITLVGADHNTYDETINKVIDNITDNPSDVYLVEVDPGMLPRVFELKSAAESKVMGEGAFVAWLAHEKAKDVRSWDLPFISQLEEGMKKLGSGGIEPVLGSVIGQGLIHVLSRETEDSADRSVNVVNLIRESLGQEVINFFEKHGVSVTPEKVSEIIRKYSGKDVSTISKTEVSDFFRPDGDGVVNRANAACNESRDEHAIREIYKAKDSDTVSSITVVAGRDHTRLLQSPLLKCTPRRSIRWSKSQSEPLCNTCYNIVMARVKISELIAKKLLHYYLELPYSGTDSANSLDSSKKYVVKVDEGIKKRMKNGLVAVDKSLDEVQSFISEFKEKGYSQIIIEEMVPHEQSEEKYLSLERVRDGFRVFYSSTGGIDIEESGSTKEALIHAENETDETAAIEKELGVPQLFISQVMGVMNKFHFSFLEINPLVVRGSEIFILDLAVEVDSAGYFSVEGAWTEHDYRHGDVKAKSQEEKNIEQLASKSQASFKFVPLNPNGSVFMLLSGGGASIVLADEVANLGKGESLANYGEYSGNPNEEETYIYTKNLLKFLLNSTDEQKVLIIAGGVANFTDVRKTFIGVIRAIEEVSHKLSEQGVKVYVRRGGPNQEEGLSMMRKFLEKKNLYGQVSGPEIILTEIVRSALSN